MLNAHLKSCWNIFKGFIIISKAGSAGQSSHKWEMFFPVMFSSPRWKNPINGPLTVNFSDILARLTFLLKTLYIISGLKHSGMKEHLFWWNNSNICHCAKKSPNYWYWNWREPVSFKNFLTPNIKHRKNYECCPGHSLIPNPQCNDSSSSVCE